MSYKGFGNRLTEDEVLLLQCFKKDELYWPDAEFREKSDLIIQKLIEKKIIHKKRPYRLTRLGKKIKANLKV